MLKRICQIAGEFHFAMTERLRPRFLVAENNAARTSAFAEFMLHSKTVVEYALVLRDLEAHEHCKKLIEKLCFKTLYELIEDLAGEEKSLQVTIYGELKTISGIQQISAFFGILLRLQKILGFVDKFYEFALFCAEKNIELPPYYHDNIYEYLKKWKGEAAKNTNDIENKLRRQLEAEMILKFSPGNIEESRRLALQAYYYRSKNIESMPIAVAIRPAVDGLYWGEIKRSPYSSSGVCVPELDVWQYFLDKDVINKILAVRNAKLADEFAMWSSNDVMLQA